MKKTYLMVFLTVIFLFVLTSPTSLLAQTGVLKSLEDDISTIVESIRPSLVTIQTKRIMPFPPGSYKGTFRKEEIMGAVPILIGSGIIYDKEGHILTTTSVIGGRENFTVTLPDGKEVEGKLVGVDPEYNLAVLKIDVTGLVPAKLGYSDKLKAGSWLTIVGNSYGLPLAVVLGIMNGQRKDGFIQMSANVSPGNSGGPVLNTKGEVVGLVSAKITEPSYISSIEIFRSESEGFSISPGQLDLPTSGVSLAIPINEAKARADEIIKNGSIKRGYLGVYITDLTEEQLKDYKIGSGVMIDRVEEGSPAQEGGLLDGDIILSYDGKKVQDSGELSKMIKQTKPKTQVQLEVLRDNKKKAIKVTLGESESRYAEGFGGSYYDALNRFGQAMGKLDREYNKGLKGSRADLQKKIDKLEKELQELKEKLENTETND
ncbi:MAG: trypsin-like peptidase domain-containing protein [candidate division Zixibacteria bacterium]|nr:trypsin-like peptidase domain-containing protein [candidate division Zixibacteria bacterium]